MKKSLNDQVLRFADAVIKARELESLGRGARDANRQTRRAQDAWSLIRTTPGGRDCFKQLLDHPVRFVRTYAAAYLLRHCHSEARAVLEEDAKNQDWDGFRSSQCLLRWEEGKWQLDPEDETAGN